MVKARAKTRQPQAKGLKIRHYLAAIVAAAVIAAGLVGWQWARYTDWGPKLTRLVVSGNFKELDPAQVRTAVKPYLHGGFFRVDLDAIRAAVVALPWVDDAAVYLDWPSTLKIDLREQRAVARWDDSGMINAAGVLFADKVPADVGKLPTLAGPAGSETQVLDEWHQMNAALKADHLALTGLVLDARGAWRATLASGLEVRLGRGRVAENLKHFIEIVPRVLGERLADAAYIDMRYTNGFAVGWKNSANTSSETTGKTNA